MECARCSSPLSVDQKFCPNCGVPVAVVPPAGDPTPTDTPAPPTSAPVYASNTPVPPAGVQVYASDTPAPPTGAPMYQQPYQPQPQIQQYQQSYQQYQVPQQPQNQVIYQTQHPYKKLGGWLMALVILGFVGAVSALFSAVISGVIMQALSRSGYMSIYYTRLMAEMYSPIYYAMLALSVIVTVVYLILLIMRKPQFLMVFQIGTFVNVVLVVVYFMVLAFSQYNQIMFTIVLAGTAGGLGGGLGGLVLYTLYFVKSIRVRTYLGSDKYISGNPLISWFIKPKAPAVPDLESL